MSTTISRLLKSTLVLLSVCMWTTAEAQWVRVLVPIASEPVAGAADSLWDWSLVGANAGEEFLQLWPTALVPYGLGSGLVAPVPIFRRPSATPPGAFVYVSSGDADALHLLLRVFDRNRLDVNWGTAVPTPRERDFKSVPIVLVDIPASSNFRSRLRVYDFDGHDGALVDVVIRDQSRNTILSQERVTLRTGIPVSPQRPGFPAAADLPFRCEGERECAVTVIPLTEGVRIWAFASITNQQTHHVTVSVP
jgi:hypothetical protein